MELRLSIYMITLILVGVTYNIPVSVSSSPATPQIMYWKTVFPNTPMPTAIKSSLQTVGKQGKNDPFRTSLVKCLLYSDAATQKEVDDYVNKYGEKYMLETQMIPGKLIQVRLLTHAENKATFLPLKDSESIPFSSHKLPQILNTFSIQPGSTEAAAIKETIDHCEKQHEGEDKFCATSLEAMVSFVKSKLGEGVSPASSTSSVNRDGKIKYQITGVKKLVEYGSPAVLCHKEQYPYAVFSCHQVDMTAAYLVSLVGDGIRVEAAAVCHKDTSWWSPKHVSFQLLKAKPGKTTPVCHFLDDLAVVWTKK